MPRDPPVYKLKDYDSEGVKEAFYDQELQKIIKDDVVYEVSRENLEETWEQRTLPCKMVRIPKQVSYIGTCF